MQAMTAGEARRVRARSGAVRWSRAVVLALIAALAVLVHHETAAGAVTRIPSSAASVMSGIPGMGSMSSMTMPMDPAGHEAPRAGTLAADSVDGACSGMAMQHCSAAGVDTLKLAPPSEPALGQDDAATPGAPTSRDIPGTVSRAPPDLSVLSRLLI